MTTIGIDPSSNPCQFGGAFQFHIPGTPIAKKRPRFFRRGRGVGTYNCQMTEEGRFALSIMDQIRTKGYSGILPLPRGTAIRLICWFAMPIPKSWPKRALAAIEAGERPPHVKKPDADNLLKFVKDCLNGVAWIDDSQVAFAQATKGYSPEPGTHIIVAPWEGENHER